MTAFTTANHVTCQATPSRFDTANSTVPVAFTAASAAGPVVRILW